MAKCNDNHRARKKRKRDLERWREAQRYADDGHGWLCWCGHWEESGLHCESCGNEPPWGCYCCYCDDRRQERYGQDDYWDGEYPEDDYSEPIGSCEWCGTNLYPDDDIDLCDQCLWHSEQNKGGEQTGLQPVV